MPFKKHKTTIERLDKGSRVLFIDIDNASTFSFDIIVRAGWRFAEKNTSEVAHLLEHVAFGGCKTYPNDEELMYQIERNGALQNASTTADLINYYYRANLDEVERIVEIAMQQFTEPLYKEETIKHEKESVLVELSNRLEQDSDRCFNQMQTRVFGDNYTSYEAGIKSLENIDRDVIVKYWKDNFDPQNIQFILSGNFSDSLKSKLLEILNTWLNKLEVNSNKNIYIPNKLADFNSKIDILDTPHNATEEFIFAWIWPELHLEELPVLKLIDSILTGGMASVLYTAARKAGLTYSIFTDTGTNIDSTGFYIVDSVVPEKTTELLKLAIKQADRVFRGNFSEQDLLRAKGFLTGSCSRNLQLPQHFSNWYASDFVFERDLRTPEEFNLLIESATVDDIVGIAQKRLTDSHWYLSLVSNKSESELDEVKELALKLR